MIKIIWKLWSFTDTQHKGLKIGIAANFARSFFSLLDYFAIYLAIEALIRHTVEGRVMIQCVVLVIIGVLGRTAMDGISLGKLTDAGYQIAKDKRLHVADKLRYVPMGHLNAMNLGEITGALTTTLSDIETVVPMVLVQFISGAIGTTVMAVFIMTFDWHIGVIALAAIAAYFFVTSRQQKALEKVSRLRQKAQETLIFQVLEYLQGIHVIKGFGLSGEKNKAIRRAVTDSCNENIALNVKITPWANGQRLILSIASAAVCGAAIARYLTDDLTLASCLFLLVMSFVLFSSLDFAGSTLSLLGLIDISMNQVNKVDALPVLESGTVMSPPKQSSIRFEQVSFAYDKNPIICDFNTKLKEKQITAIVGHSGSGKTTLTRLLARFWDVDQGKITLDGIDIKEYDYDILLSQISYVFQDVYLFNDTVLHNIGFGRFGATDEDIAEAAKKARCHEFITKLPDGYHTLIGEGGSSLSGGEKQRISIARAILKDAPIIVLDEATASVDPENELEIMEAIHALSQDKTCIIIAHRLNTVRKAGQILVLDSGSIVQHGRHEELMKQDGIYRQFVRRRELSDRWKI